MSAFTFLVTGASSGFGAQIARAALKAGHGVVATARNVSKAKESYSEIERRGGHWLSLDVTASDTESIVAQAIQDYNVNVVVNNAGWALRGVLEDLSMTEIRTQMETNLFGALAVTKGCIPTFRSRNSGTIVIISSTAGISGNAGYSLYSASKFALEGASESLAAELAAFNIRVLLVEPGAFRTNFQAAVQEPAVGLSEPYKGTAADQVRQRISSSAGQQPGDPEKAAQAILDVVTATGNGKDVEGLLRLPLGKDAVQRAYSKIKGFSENVDKVKHISESVDFDE